MLDVGDRSDYMADLFLGKNTGQSEFTSGIKCMGHYIRRGQYVFKKETAALGCHPAFIPADPVFFFDVVDVGGNVILGKLLRDEVVVIGKYIAHLGHIIADGHG
jgi:hypothetical protein